MRLKPFMQKSRRQLLFLLCLPILGMQSALAGLDIQAWKTDEGAKVLYVQTTQLPMLDIKVTFDAGSVRDGNNWGLARFTSALLGTATTTKNEVEIAESFNALGAQFSTNSRRDGASISLRTLTRAAIKNAAIDSLVDVLKNAQFDGGIFAREQQRLLTALRQKAVQPQKVAGDLVWEKLYPDHPYGHPVEGDQYTLTKLQLAQLQQFYLQHYRAQGAVIALVGDISRAEAEGIAKQISQALPKSEKPLPPIPKPVPLKKAKTVTQEFASTQTYYQLVQLGVKRGDPDYIPLFVGNHLLGGGGFGSYLMEEVREKRGLVYSVYSYFTPMREQGPFVIGLSTKNASAKEAEKVVHETLHSFLQDFDDDKFAATKENLIGGWPLRFDSNGKIIGYISMIGFYNLPLDYLDWFPKAVEKVTKQEVLAAWQKHIHPDKMLTVMVGKPE